MCLKTSIQSACLCRMRTERHELVGPTLKSWCGCRDALWVAYGSDLSRFPSEKEFVAHLTPKVEPTQA